MKSPILIYDFDGTLTPYAWTKFEILERCGFDGGAYSPIFIDRVHATAQKDNSNNYAALWKEYLHALRENHFSLTDQNFVMGAQNLEYNPGVEDFLLRTNTKHAKNYILSSGLKIFLEHTKIAPQFRKIYATTFSYNDNNQANGVDFLMDEKRKVAVLRQILLANERNPEDCHGVIYFGDGLTDFYAMEYIKNHGGETVFVYQRPNQPANPKDSTAHTSPHSPDFKDPDEIISSFPDPNVVSFQTPADYSADSQLNHYIENFL